MFFMYKYLNLALRGMRSRTNSLAVIPETHEVFMTPEPDHMSFVSIIVLEDSQDREATQDRKEYMLMFVFMVFICGTVPLIYMNKWFVLVDIIMILLMTAYNFKPFEYFTYQMCQKRYESEPITVVSITDSCVSL